MPRTKRRDIELFIVDVFVGIEKVKEYEKLNDMKMVEYLKQL